MTPTDKAKAVIESCLLCDREFKWKEVVICYLNNAGQRLDFCMPCCERWDDDKKRDNVKWGVYQYGISDFEFIKANNQE